MNEHEADVERVDRLDKSLNDAMANAINRLGSDQPALMRAKVRKALTNQPRSQGTRR